MAGRLAGKVAIVTGAGSRGEGIGNGKAAALLFAREGAAVLCADLVVERAQETVDAIVKEGGQAAAFAADVTRSEDCRAMVAAAVGRFGRLDILHNNVGFGAPFQALEDVTGEAWDQVMAVNVRGMVFCAQAAAPAMKAAGGGSIINISSVAALRSLPGPAANATAYATSKAGVIGLTINLAGQLAPHRIRVNCIVPGQVYTPMVAWRLTPEERTTRTMQGLLQDEGTGWDIGWAAVFFASDESRWVTGQALTVDAGLTITTR
ncbi:MAG: glucose 1-dehydrogenase [Dehalococcoidia bacterium]|nr:glucose 1-dehydrogenase [Dehalococcoidia bacterium]